jgi:branched-chain amino acid transport system substrate-binding protein
MTSNQHSVNHRAMRRTGAAVAPIALTLLIAACSSSASSGSAASPSTSAPAASGASSSSSTSTNWPSNVTDFLAYTGGKSGAADSSLPPVEIGWVNNQGGSITPLSPTGTLAATTAVNYINSKLGGVGGHPLKLDQCFIQNAEEEGLTCAQKFLSNKNVMAVAFGGVQIGANTMESTLAGKLPIVQSVSLNPGDPTAKNDYILFGTAQLTLAAQGSFNKDFLHAKTAAVVYATDQGNSLNAQFVQNGLVGAGVTTKMVGYNDQQGDISGALVAAGAQTADVVNLLLSGNDCVKAAAALQTLGVDKPVVSFTECVDPTIKSAYPGGDYPANWYYSISQSGDSLLTDPPSPAGQAYHAVLNGQGQGTHYTDPWWSATVSQIFTIDQWLNKIGYDNLSPAAVASQAKSFKGPLMLGAPTVDCGKYPSLPASCSDSLDFFQYKGSGVFNRVGGWQSAPASMLTKLSAGASSPSS